DNSENLYVADSLNSRIQKFDSEGNFLIKWGTKGSDDGQFDSPWDVAVDVSGNVYVADAANRRIQKFTSLIVVTAVEPAEKLNISWGSVKEASDSRFSFALRQNYPNPFNPETWIPYQLATASEVTIRIYSATGQLVRLLSVGYREAGLYMSKDAAVYWDGRTDTGEDASSGVYFYNIHAGRFSTTKKMIVIP
ncbi:T9SS type A sorting domain-containing protein, partial [Candidatus Poribacteria bacterium]